MRLLILCFFVVPTVACSAEVVFEDDGAGAAGGRPTASKCLESYNALGGAFAKCTNCHSSHLMGGARNAAPIDANFDTYEGATAYRAKIKQRLEDFTMPQLGYPQLSKTERDQMIEWTECGGPL